MSKSLILQGLLGHNKKARFHSKCNIKPLKDFLFLSNSALIFSKLCLAAVWKEASVEGGRPVYEACAVISARNDHGLDLRMAEMRSVQVQGIV